jgi:hypothetical protein
MLSIPYVRLTGPEVLMVLVYHPPHRALPPQEIAQPPTPQRTPEVTRPGELYSP